MFWEENFLSYLDLCYVNLRVPQIKDIPSIIGFNSNRGFKKLFFFAKSATFGVKGILLPLLHSVLCFILIQFFNNIIII